MLAAGGMAFTLRVEQGVPGQPTGVETFTQVTPVLLAGPRGAEGQQYAASVGPLKIKSGGVFHQVASVLPGKRLGTVASVLMLQGQERCCTARAGTSFVV